LVLIERWVEQDYMSNVKIDFDELTDSERMELAIAVLEGSSWEFDDVDLYFQGDVEIEVDADEVCSD